MAAWPGTRIQTFSAGAAGTLAGRRQARRQQHRAELAVGVVAASVAALADIRSAIGFSSFAVLHDDAIANASALTLRTDKRRWPRLVAVLGLVGCVVIAFTLPPASVATGVALLLCGALIFLLRSRRRRPPSTV